MPSHLFSPVVAACLVLPAAAPPLAAGFEPGASAPADVGPTAVEPAAIEPAAVEPGGYGPRIESTVTHRWKVGIIVRAAAPSGGIFGTASVPVDWPEQKVKVLSEEKTAQVAQLEYRTAAGGLKQMLVSIPRMGGGETASALVTFEIQRSSLAPPENPRETLRLPTRPPRDVLPYLGASPFIQTRSGKIKSKAKELVAGRETAWEQVEAIFDFVRDEIEFRDGELQGAQETLESGGGMNEDLSSLFIALCRSQKIPARTVWVDGHNYPEFYLQDEEGNGYWFPCQVAGPREFGGISETRPILQKGENFKVPESKQPQRFVGEFLTVKTPGGKPQVEFVRQLLAAE